MGKRRKGNGTYLNESGKKVWGQYVLKVEGGMREIKGGGNTTMKPDIVYAL